MPVRQHLPVRAESEIRHKDSGTRSPGRRPPRESAWLSPPQSEIGVVSSDCEIETGIRQVGAENAPSTNHEFSRCGGHKWGRLNLVIRNVLNANRLCPGALLSHRDVFRILDVFVCNVVDEPILSHLQYLVTQVLRGNFVDIELSHKTIEFLQEFGMQFPVI